jgi:hypothetical protein
MYISAPFLNLNPKSLEINFADVFTRLDFQADFLYNSVAMLEQRIREYLEIIRSDVASLRYLETTDFFNFFPKSEQDQVKLEKEADKISTIVTQSVRGDYRKFHTPCKTEFGEISIFKIRPYCEDRSAYIGGADFIVREWDKFVKTYKDDERFTYFEVDTHPECRGYLFQTEKSFFCFCNPPVSDKYK